LFNSPGYAADDDRSGVFSDSPVLFAHPVPIAGKTREQGIFACVPQCICFARCLCWHSPVVITITSSRIMAGIVGTATAVEMVMAADMPAFTATVDMGMAVTAMEMVVAC
jgi:hypothetical protein